ncbi:MAG: DUF2029 domain-containing protein [Anaerolineae bacterium]|nr:DUF2029 domain-containing protein [Anaerolineae bacterium]
MKRRPFFVLGLTGLGLLVLYAVAFLIPYNAYIWAPQGNPADIGLLSGYSWVAFLGYVLAVSLLYFCYFKAWRTVGQVACPRKAFQLIFGVGILGALLLVQVYPYAAVDVFLYIVRGRVLGIYGGNPLSTPPNVYPLKPYLPFHSEWASVPSPYGPLWEWIAAGLARLGNGSLLRSLLVFKAFSLLCYLGCLIVLALLLRERAPQEALPGFLLFAWNPLVLLEPHAMGHNDLLMVFFVLLGLLAWQRARYPWAIVALMLGVLVKYVPLLLFPPLLVLMWRRLERPHFWRVLFQGGALSIALLLLVFGPLWTGWSHLGLFGQMQRGHHSVFVWLFFLLSKFFSLWTSFRLCIWSLRLAFLVSYVLILLWAWHRQPSLARVFFWVLYSALVFLMTSFGYWYVSWLVALLPLIPRARERALGIAFSWTGLMSVALYTFIGSWLSGLIKMGDFLLGAVPLVFGPPLLFAWCVENGVFDKYLQGSSSS